MGDLGTFLLRVSSGSMMLIFHGWPKIVGLYSFLSNGNWKFANTISSIGFPLPVLFAILFALFEFLCSISLIVGFMTRLSAGILGVLMLTFVVFHSKFGFSFELVFLYLIIFIVLLLVGGGKYSLDNYLRRK